MADHGGKKVNEEKELVRRAVRKIASTEAGIIFFRWLKSRCHYDYTTLSGNSQSHEVNELATIGREYERKLYLDIRAAFNEKHKINIEVLQHNTKESDDG